MPRFSPYNVLLTDEVRGRLQESSRKYTSSYCDVVPAKVILMAADGVSNKGIGQRLDLPRQIVSKWRKRFYREHLAEVPRYKPHIAPFPSDKTLEWRSIANCRWGQGI